MTLSTTLDSRLYERLLKKKEQAAPSKKPFSSVTPHASPSKPSVSPATFPAFIADDTVPMDNTINRITSKERKHRRINNLCYYCGFADHKRVNCFKRSMRQVQINTEVMFILL